MRSFLAICVAVAICFGGLPASAQALWGASQYGMTVEQTKKAFPEAKAPIKSAKLGDGATELLRIENIELVNEKFDAQFFYMNSRLVQVTLTVRGNPSFHSAFLIFQRLETALNVKYGQPMGRKVERGMPNVAGADWQSGRTNINLLAMAVGNNDAVLNINYQVRVAKDADKL